MFTVYQGALIPGKKKYNKNPSKYFNNWKFHFISISCVILFLCIFLLSSSNNKTQTKTGERIIYHKIANFVQQKSEFLGGQKANIN